MISSLFGPKLAIRDVLTGKEAVLTKFPAFVGGSGAHFEVEEGDRALLEITSVEKQLKVDSLGEPMLAGGVDKSTVYLAEEDQVMIACGGHFLLLAHTKKHLSVSKNGPRIHGESLTQTATSSRVHSSSLPAGSSFPASMLNTGRLSFITHYVPRASTWAA